MADLNRIPVVRTNAAAVVTTRIFGTIVHPKQAGQYHVDSSGHPFLLPGMGGVCRNLRLGSKAFGWASDHGEPGASIGSDDPGEYIALQIMSCLGNQVSVLSGPARGAEGIVIGKHAYILAEFPSDASQALAPYDEVAVEARGQGLRLLDYPAVTLRGCSPELLGAMPVIPLSPGVLQVDVAVEIPVELLGAGVGMDSEWGGQDVMLTSDAIASKFGLEQLRLGDVVAMPGANHRFGRGYDPTHVTIGVVCHTVGPTPGHGVGVASIMTGPAASVRTHLAADANVGRYLGLIA